MIMFFSFCLLMYVAAIYFSPFPYWKTYVILWKTICFDKNKAIGSGPRKKQAAFLIKYAVFCPIWTGLWYLDEILYPEYKKVQVQPVFIMGQPRSGTTFFHRTLAADKTNFVAIKHIEWRFPYIFFQKILLHSNLVGKIIQKSYWSDSSAGRIASKMHPNKLSDWEEDGIFFEECFLHHFFIFLRFPYPQLLEFLDDFQALPEVVQDKMLETHKKVIQKIMFFRGDGTKYYLSKEVTSHNKFPKLLRLYPDAKFIFSFRHSIDFMNSLVSLVRVSTKSKIGVDPIEIPLWESVFEDRMRKDSLRLIDLCGRKIKDDSQVRVVFHQFTKDLIPSIECLYKKFDFELSQEYLKYLDTINKTQKSRARGYDYEKKKYEGFEKFDEFVDKIDQEFMLLRQKSGIK